MKSFLDRFRRKGREETATEDAQELFSKPDPAKATIIMPPPALSNIAKPVPAPAASPVDSSDVRLELGDFLHRIPLNLLRPGQHHVGTELRFNISELSALIAKGQTTVNLAEIYRRAPTIFRSEVRATDNIEIRFPWQKLLNLVKEADAGGKNGLSRATAESLGQKLRSRRPTRNILSAAPAPAPAPAPEPNAAAEEPREKPVTKSGQPGWNNKAGAEKSTGASPLRLPQPTNAEADRATTKPETTLNLVLEEPASQATAESQPSAALSTPSAGSSDTTEALKQERDRLAAELARTRQELVSHAARATKANFECDTLAKRVHALEHGGENVTAITAARDVAQAELAQVRQQLAEKVEALELSAGSPQEAAQTSALTEALENKITALSKQVELLSSELAEEKRGAEEKLVAAARERDELAQQKAKLTEQLAGANDTAVNRQKAGLDAVRSKKENQRQLDELQRRIHAFESSQKEITQELTRERETRIKAERSLNSAERGWQETTSLLEALRTETRREIETAARKRESEFARTQKDWQEKMDALAEANRLALAERDSLAAELETLRTAANQPAVADAWEARAVASLEEDIASYRTRIKTLLAERDQAATDARTGGAAALAERNSVIADKQQALESVQAELVARSQEQVATQQQLEQTRQALAELQKSFGASGEEMHRAKEEAEQLSQELKRAREDAQRQAERIASERIALEATLAETQQRLGELQAARNADREAMERRLAESSAGLDSTRAASEQHLAELRAQHAEAVAAQHALSAELSKLRADHTAAHDELAGLRTELSLEHAERELLQKRIDAEESAVAARAKALEQQLGEAQQIAREQSAEHAKSAASLQEKCAALENGIAEKEKGLTAELAAASAEIKTQKTQSSEGAREVKSLTKQRDDALAETERLRAAALEDASAVAKTRAELGARFDREVAELRREHEALLHEREELQARIEQLLAEQHTRAAEIAPEVTTQASLSNKLMQASREREEANVIDMASAASTGPAHSDPGIELPRSGQSRSRRPPCITCKIGRESRGTSLARRADPRSGFHAQIVPDVAVAVLARGPLQRLAGG